MLKIFYGKDESVTRAKARECALSHAEDSDLIITFESHTFNKPRFEEIIFSQSMLGPSIQVVLGDHLFDDKDIKSFFEKHAKEISATSNVCILAEGTLLKDSVEKFKKSGALLTETASPIKKNVEFNIFALADALGTKDKKDLWILFAQAREAGVEGEEICGTLFWQLKMIALAYNTKTAIEAGVSEYPYKKAKSFIKIWKEDEVKKNMQKLTEIYHNAHRGKGNILNQLELWVLGIK